ncbi:hypothetical protein [Streptomyces cucumeris]|nr:hypothetical protein [Streptomyces sp. NEAU-Y11]MCP9210988.1 hypothetical protein [Streptomyces sp. NEAU-Y11]
MNLKFPTAAELREEQDLRTLKPVSRDTGWNVHLKDDDGLEPADVQGI